MSQILFNKLQGYEPITTHISEKDHIILRGLRYGDLIVHNIVQWLHGARVLARTVDRESRCIQLWSASTRDYQRKKESEFASTHGVSH
jgi:hypothetical protein